MGNDLNLPPHLRELPCSLGWVRSGAVAEVPAARSWVITAPVMVQRAPSLMNLRFQRCLTRPLETTAGCNSAACLGFQLISGRLSGLEDGQ